MNRYLVLYHAPVSAREMMANASPEEAKSGMDAWMAWAQRAGSSLVDLGLPLGGGVRIDGSGSADAGDGASGYSVLQAESLEAAKSLLEGHPHLMMPGGSIELREGLPLPGM